MTRLEYAKIRLQMYQEAEQAILTGAQSYEIGERKLTRANLSEIQEMIDKLYDDIEYLEGKSKGFAKRVVLK